MFCCDDKFNYNYITYVNSNYDNQYNTVNPIIFSSLKFNDFNLYDILVSIKFSVTL